VSAAPAASLSEINPFVLVVTSLQIEAQSDARGVCNQRPMIVPHTAKAQTSASTRKGVEAFLFSTAQSCGRYIQTSTQRRKLAAWWSG
jgi:hypothetical protein